MEILPRAAASEMSVDARGVAGFVRACAASGLELHGVMVVKRGHVVAEGSWAPYTPGTRQLVYSLSKVLTSLAVGIAADEGLLRLDDRIADLLAARLPAHPAPWALAARVRDLLTMSTGHEQDQIEPLMRAVLAGRDPVAAAMELPAEHDPGAVFTYNQVASLLLSAAVTEVTGQRLAQWLRPRLLDPLGVGDLHWAVMPGAGAAVDQGFSGAHVTVEEIAALGELLRCGGAWRGRQLVSQEYVRQASIVQISTEDRATNADWRRGYGFHLWRSTRQGFRGDGAFGQLCVVLPEAEAVVAVTGQTIWMQDELRHLWMHLLPALTAGGSAAADADGRAALSGLALPPQGHPGPCAYGRPGLLDVEHEVARPPRFLEAVQAVRLRRDGEQLLMAWRVAGQWHEVVVGRGRWAEGRLPVAPALLRSEVAVSGDIAVDGESASARVQFVESPHAVTVVVQRGGVVRLRWRTTPL